MKLQIESKFHKDFGYSLSSKRFSCLNLWQDLILKDLEKEFLKKLLRAGYVTLDQILFLVILMKRLLFSQLKNFGIKELRFLRVVFQNIMRDSLH